MLSSFDRSRSTLRTATVTTSAPDASIASIICAFDAYLPVPTIRRERNSRPAITNGLGSANAAVDDGLSKSACATSASPDKVDDLERVIRLQRQRSEGIAVAQNRSVALDHYYARIESQRCEEVRQRPIRGDPALRSVHRESDLRLNYFGSHHTCER